MQWLAIAIGGATGAVARFWMTNAIYALTGRDFPWGTLAVNILGSFLMGVGYALLVERFAADPLWRTLLLAGFLGAFTTFSTFSFETFGLIQQGAWGRAVVNTLLSVVLTIVAVALGMALVQRTSPL
jgi:fluoride exporter